MAVARMSRRTFVSIGSSAAACSLLTSQGIAGQQNSPQMPYRAPTAPNDGTQYQAKPPKTQPFGDEAFHTSRATTVRWLGSAGLFLNCHGTTAMLDPLMEGYDLPFMIDLPIMPKQVPRLDAVFITHSDNDHYSVQTCNDLKSVTSSYRSTHYVDSLMKEQGLPSFGYGIGESFSVGPMKVTLTPADHAYQNAHPRPGMRHFDDSDACGFRIETPDGTIWAPGDTRLMEAHLRQPTPDVLFMDFSDNDWHFTLAGAAKVANAYPNTPILLSHWGTVDAPNFSPFNGDPKKFQALLTNPQRMQMLAPGQPYTIAKLKSA